MAELPPVVAADLLKEFISAGASYLECKEREITRRERIAAELEAKLTLINKNYDLNSKILASRHEEVMRAYQTAEKLLQTPQILEDAAKLKAVLEFLAKAHSDHSLSLLPLR